MSTYKIIQSLAATRSRNDKEAILQSEVTNEELKTFFKLALDPFINFFQKKVFVQKQSNVVTSNLSNAMGYLMSRISTRVVTGNAAITEINTVLSTLSKDDAKCLMMILQKDPRAGLGISTVNKVWPGLIREFPCLLATAWDDKLAAKLPWASGVISQLKSDGLRVNIIIDENGGVTAYTRAGNELNMFGQFDILGTKFKNVVIDGELLTINVETGKFNNRQTSNGICNKAVKNTMSEQEAATLHCVSWDVIPYEDFQKTKCMLQYKERWATLQKMMERIPELSSIISTVPSRIVHSINQAQEHYTEMLSAGEEGTMVKDPAMLWSDTRSKLQLKLKDTATADLQVVGFIEGTGKLIGNLGSLNVQTSDSLCNVSMSGFSMKVRSEIWANLTNKPVVYTMVVDGSEKEFTASPGDIDVDLLSIIEIKYNQKIKARDSDVWSLFLPRFSKTRPDKKVANKLEEL
jgi:ATP-dependent DNA ligase